jgi:peptide/nickel transport system permease protein
MIPVILSISLVIFTLMSFAPGDPAQIELGIRASPESLNAFREEHGLNDPFWIQYFRYIWSAIHGDFGTSYRTGLPVFQEILSRFPITLKVAFGALALVLLIGVPVGVLSAVKQYSVLDNSTLVLALMMSSMPGFWLGTLLIILFALYLGWLPATFTGGIKGYLLPWFTLAAAQLATLVRNTRSNMLEVIRSEYIMMARAKGAREFQVIVGHALRNALMPIVTILGLNFMELLGGTVIIEQVFAIPGLSSLALVSVRKLDIPMVMGIVLFIAAVMGFVNLFIDVVYVFINPRLKSMYMIRKDLRD